MKTILLALTSVVIFGAEAGAVDDKHLIKTSIVTLADEFAKNPVQAVVKYGGKAPALPQIEFSGNVIGYDGKMLFMHTETNVKVLVQCECLTGEKPESSIISGVARFHEYKDHTVYLIASKLSFAHEK